MSLDAAFNGVWGHGSILVTMTLGSHITVLHVFTIAFGSLLTYCTVSELDRRQHYSQETPCVHVPFL